LNQEVKFPKEKQAKSSYQVYLLKGTHNWKILNRSLIYGSSRPSLPVGVAKNGSFTVKRKLMIRNRGPFLESPGKPFLVRLYLKNEKCIRLKLLV